MTRRTKLSLSALALILLAWWLWPQSDSARESAQSADDLAPLANRIWIDHIPRNERDKVELFVMFEDPTVGGFSRSSAFEGDWTSFEWSLERGLRFHMLQAQKTHKVSAKITKGAQCAPFDYCLRLEGAPRAAKRYGSMEDWVITGGAEQNPRAMLDRLF